MRADAKSIRATLGARWWFSLLLGFVYLGVFHAWMFLAPPAIRVTALAVTAALAVAMFCAHRQGYFVNGWDRLFHAAVLVDIALEGWLIQVHNHYGFYWCALGFAAVIGGYRLRRLSGRPGPASG